MLHPLHWMKETTAVAGRIVGSCWCWQLGLASRAAFAAAAVDCCRTKQWDDRHRRIRSSVVGRTGFDPWTSGWRRRLTGRTAAVPWECCQRVQMAVAAVQTQTPEAVKIERKEIKSRLVFWTFFGNKNQVNSAKPWVFGGKAWGFWGICLSFYRIPWVYSKEWKNFPKFPEFFQFQALKLKFGQIFVQNISILDFFEQKVCF